MKTLLNKYFAVMLLCIGFSLPTYAIELNGLMTVDPKTGRWDPVLDENGDPVLNPRGNPLFVFVLEGGSYFSMGSDNPAQGASIQDGTAGGMILGTNQRFILNPDEPHPFNWNGNGGAAGTGYSGVPVAESTAMTSFKFFGVSTYIGTNGLSYQSGNAKPPVTATVDVNGNLLVELSSWEVMWNGSAFEQGPRFSAATGFFPAEGTYDFETGDYVVAWPARIVGGPFNGVVGFWHLEGTILADPVNADVVSEPATINVKSQSNDYSMDLRLTDTDGTVIPAADINEGIMISSVAGVDVPAGAIVETFEIREIEEEGAVLDVAFKDPARGSRQDVIALLSDAIDKSVVPICIKGTARDANGILRPFEGCANVKVNNKGGR